MTRENLYVGIDVSKSKHDVAIINEQKQLCGRPLIIQENRPSYQTLVARLKQLLQPPRPTQIYIGLEATSNYWKNLYYFLVQAAADFTVPLSLTVINPLQTKAFAQTILRRSKTDKVDARMIAQFMAEKKPPASAVPLPQFEVLKDLDRQIHALRKQLTMNVNKLRLELYKVAPELELALSSLTGQQILALLLQYPTAEAIAQATTADLRQIQYGRHQLHLAAPLVQKIQTLAQQSVAYKTGPGTDWVVQTLVRQIQHLQHQIQWLQQHIVGYYQQFQPHLSRLATIPGVTPETACLLEAYIGDVQRFPSAKKLVAFFGMNPRLHDSGYQKKSSVTPLQKKGEGRVRHKLFMIVLLQIRYQQNPFYRYYRRLVDSGKPKLVAIGATMRKLLVTIYAMLKNQQDFDPEKV